jgi:hypothetical protein
MAEGETQTLEERGTQPPGSSSRGVGGFWPVVAVPTFVIAVAATAGQFWDAEVTLAVGVLVFGVLGGLLAYHVMGRKRAWAIGTIMGITTLVVFGLGLLRVDKIPSISTAPKTTAEAMATGTQRPSAINTGRVFTQQTVNDERNFRGADLRGAQFVGLDLRGYDFSGVDAAGASFAESRLDRAVFRGADLGGAVLIRTCLHNAILEGADLTGAVATEADVSGVNVSQTTLSTVSNWPKPGTTSSACT